MRQDLNLQGIIATGIRYILHVERLYIPPRIPKLVASFREAITGGANIPGTVNWLGPSDYPLHARTR